MDRDIQVKTMADEPRVNMSCKMVLQATEKVKAKLRDQREARCSLNLAFTKKLGIH